MATRKTSTSKTKKSAGRKKVSAKPASAARRSGPLPPYGVPIREAIARGNPREMKAIAASARKHITSVQSALAALDKSLAKR